MKALLILIMVFSFTGCSTTKTVREKKHVEDETLQTGSPVNFYEAQTWLLGYFTRRMMTTPPHSEWFQKGYDEYEFNDAVNKLTEISKEEISIKIVMGSWCPDSRREVPRFMKILDFWNFPDEKIVYIGVDDSKYSPLGEYPALGIERVPTFIFLRNNIETGRIIENPLASLEQDMVDILSRE